MKAKAEEFALMLLQCEICMVNTDSYVTETL